MAKYMIFVTLFSFLVLSIPAQDLKPIDLYEDYEPIWLSDGNKLFFSSSNHPTQNIFTYDLQTSEVEQLTYSRTGYGNGFPSPSPDGKYIIYVSEEDGNRDIYMIRIDGSNPRRLTFDTAWDGERVGWANDNRSFIFHSNRDGNTELYQYHLETGNIRRLTHNSSF